MAKGDFDFNVVHNEVMKHVSIEVNSDWKLRYLDFDIENQSFDRLLEEISDDRKARFNKIVISGGIAVQQRSGRTPKLFTHLGGVQGKQVGFVYGYFDPMRGEIRLFPETILEVLLNNLSQTERFRTRLHSNNAFSGMTMRMEQGATRAPASAILIEFEKEFYPMLIEELEHGFQDVKEEKYRSWSMKLFSWSTRFIPLYLMLTIGYVVFTQKNYWWFGVIFAGMLAWMFFPVWFAYFPRPKWWRRLRYVYNRREKDAKGKAVSMRFFKLAKSAIKFDFSKS